MLGLVSAAVLAAVPSIVIEILFGRSYLGAAKAVRVLGLEAAGLGVLALMIYLHLARGSLDALYAWLGVAIATVGILLVHSSPVAIAVIMLISVAIATMFALVSAVHALLRDPIVDEMAVGARDLFGAALGQSSLDLSIVVPYYNPGDALSKHITSLVEVLDDSGFGFEVIAVSDGSTDGSPDTLENLFPSILTNIKLPKNLGKGQALRAGLLRGKGRYLGFIDADGDIPAIELIGIIEILRSSQPGIIYGSKRHPSSVVYYSKLRRIYSWGYQQLIKALFNISVTDTQTGLKVIRREVVAEVLPRMVEKRFAFDLEFFVVTNEMGYRRIIEVPVVIQRRFGSTIALGAVRDMLIDTLGIFYRLRVLSYYRWPHAKEVSRLSAVDLKDGAGELRILIFNWRDLKHPLAGGAEVYTDAVATEWVRMGHSVTLFCSHVDGEPNRDVAAAGYIIVRRGKRHLVYREAKKFWKAEGDRNFDLVIEEVNTRPFFCGRFIKGIPVIVLIYQIAREVWFYESALPIALLGRFFFEPWWLWKLRNQDIVTISESSRESIMRFGPNNVRLVPVGYRELELPIVEKEAAATLVFLGRLSSNKRPWHAIKAYKIVRRAMPEVRMWVIGDGPKRRMLERRSVEGVEFLGRISESEKLKRLCAAHLLVVTSVREGWGMVVTEAARAGTPSIGYDVPGLRDSLRLHGGLRVRPSPRTLASAVVDVIRGERTLFINDGVESKGIVRWSEVAESIIEPFSIFAEGM